MKRIVITPGEPAGVGPDVAIRIAACDFPAELTVVADPDVLITRAKQINFPLELIEFDEKKISPHQKNILKIIPVSLKTHCTAGELNKENSSYVLQCLEIAAEFCQKKTFHALVTGPVHKGVINAAGIAFSGHTEFLAHFFQVKKSVMLFVADNMKVALLTTHLPLKEVPAHITQDLLIETIQILNQDLKKLFGVAQPIIAVCGLNPHAGEMGHLGREEIDVIIPALKNCMKKNIRVTGPLPADTAFIPQQLKTVDAVLAMYHDQALPVVKHHGIEHAVNVTLGLPIVRTSVDHGTALSLAGTDQVNCQSLEKAILLACKITEHLKC